LTTMPMPPYRVGCYSPDCLEEAQFKIASRWSDGVIRELKTYALSCEACLQRIYTDTVERSARCRLTAGETLEVPGIYRLIRGNRDRQLERCPELEK